MRCALQARGALGADEVCRPPDGACEAPRALRQLPLARGSKKMTARRLLPIHSDAAGQLGAALPTECVPGAQSRIPTP